MFASAKQNRRPRAQSQGHKNAAAAASSRLRKPRIASLGSQASDCKPQISSLEQPVRGSSACLSALRVRIRIRTRNANANSNSPRRSGQIPIRAAEICLSNSAKSHLAARTRDLPIGAIWQIWQISIGPVCAQLAAQRQSFARSSEANRAVQSIGICACRRQSKAGTNSTCIGSAQITLNPIVCVCVCVALIPCRICLIRVADSQIRGFEQAQLACCPLLLLTTKSLVDARCAHEQRDCRRSIHLARSKPCEWLRSLAKPCKALQTVDSARIGSTYNNRARASLVRSDTLRTHRKCDKPRRWPPIYHRPSWSALRVVAVRVPIGSNATRPMGAREPKPEISAKSQVNSCKCSESSNSNSSLESAKFVCVCVCVKMHLQTQLQFFA